jgi:hypothetical protein
MLDQLRPMYDARMTIAGTFTVASVFQKRMNSRPRCQAIAKRNETGEGTQNCFIIDAQISSYEQHIGLTVD